MRIQPATAADVPLIVQLNDALFQEDAGQRDHTVNLDWAREHGRDHFQRLVAREGGLCLLAIVDDETVGYLAGYTRPKSDYKLVPTAELESMFIQAGFRGQGIGTALAQSFLGWAREKGAQEVQVTAYTANEKAVRFYQRLGFVARHITFALGL